ncbi:MULTISPECIES: hypothetical protein [Haloferax]|uniref:Uncharacterized protein n=1 Tax=Haloferax marinum TaxID=2666143 RepID=A0A6A8G9J5_9EURY|nr:MULTISPECIES: hypothetical protein [Haloferax]KAB1197732.1 hypothetical protein Hfx1150_09435 [Haloferax sp. CBA1150]MRW96786.1 hypothetical protein [Haloferax marinum]
MFDSDSEETEQNKTLMRQANYLSHKCDTIIDDWHEFGTMGAIKDDLNLFIITTHAAIEDVTTHIIIRHVIDEQFTDAAFDYVYSSMSQSHREQLLAECGILSDTTRGRLGEFRGLRNSVAHVPFVQLNWKDQNIEEKLVNATKALERLTHAALDEGRITEIVQRDDEGV